MHHSFLLSLFTLLSCHRDTSVLQNPNAFKEIAQVLIGSSDQLPGLTQGPGLFQREKLKIELKQLPPFFRRNHFSSKNEEIIAYDVRSHHFVTGLQEKKQVKAEQGKLFDLGLWLLYHFKDDQNFMAYAPSYQNPLKQELVLQEICLFSKKSGQQILSTHKFSSNNQEWKNHDQFQEVYTLRFLDREGQQWAHWLGHHKGKLHYSSQLYQLSSRQNSQISVSNSDDLIEQFGPKELEYKTYASVERAPAQVEVLSWSTQNREKNCFTPSEIINNKQLDALML